MKICDASYIFHYVLETLFVYWWLTKNGFEKVEGRQLYRFGPWLYLEPTDSSTVSPRQLWDNEERHLSLYESHQNACLPSIDLIVKKNKLNVKKHLRKKCQLKGLWQRLSILSIHQLKKDPSVFAIKR